MVWENARNSRMRNLREEGQCSTEKYLTATEKLSIRRSCLSNGFSNMWLEPRLLEKRRESVEVEVIYVDISFEKLY